MSRRVTKPRREPCTLCLLSSGIGDEVVQLGGHTTTLLNIRRCRQPPLGAQPVIDLMVLLGLEITDLHHIC